MEESSKNVRIYIIGALKEDKSRLEQEGRAGNTGKNIDQEWTKDVGPPYKELTENRTHRKLKKKLTTKFIPVKFEKIKDKENI